MGDMGKNQETVEEFITHSFDPFKNETVTKLNLPTIFQAADIAFLHFRLKGFNLLVQLMKTKVLMLTD